MNLIASASYNCSDDADDVPFYGFKDCKSILSSTCFRRANLLLQNVLNVFTEICKFFVYYLKY